MSDVDWLGLAHRASIDPGELKRRLDLVAVCETLGMALEEGPDGKWHGLCPFHDDHKPSFDVYEKEDGTQACGCMACDFGPSNDVYDFLRALRGYSFGEALVEAQSLSASVRAAPRESKALAKREVDFVALVDGAVERAKDDDAAIHALLSDRSLRVPADWLKQEFGLGVTPDGGGVLVPHRAPDGSPTAAKVRRATTEDRPWKPIAISGSKLNQLYGMWRDRGRRSVVLVEGESDTWTVAWLMRFHDCEVFGLPSGAAARPRRDWLDFLAERDVTLLFDADDAGRLALAHWAAGLGVVRVAQLDEGQDATSERPERVLETLAHSQVVGTAPQAGLQEAPFGGYVRAGDVNQTMIANFVLRLVRTVELPGAGYVFDVALPDGRVVPLPSTELENESKLRRWANAWGYVFQGVTRDTQELLRMLVVDSVFRPRTRGTTVAGWSEDTFVFPDPHGCIGGRSWAYVPPVNSNSFERLIELQPGKWDPHVPRILATLHQPDVITPILGWVAAAPLRPLVRAFPILAVVGTAGAGKSTLIREVLATFGFRANTTLTSTTGYGVTSFVEATNSVPVWFDEYRRGARDEAKQRFEQILRDAWESSSSYKGGMGENRSELSETVARAPIVVTGEDAFSETSHLERMVFLTMSRAGRNPKALEALYAANRQGFGRAYLEWLAEKVNSDSLPEPPAVNDRPSQSRAVATWGYSLLDAFCREVIGEELPPLDLSRVLAQFDEADSHPILLEALRACESRNGRSGPIVWTEGGDTCVRLHDLLREARDLNLQLPGGARALRNELEERFDVVEDKNVWGQFLRLRGLVV